MKLINLFPISMWIYAAYSSFNHHTVLPRHHTQTTITLLFQFVYKHDMHLQRIDMINYFKIHLLRIKSTNFSFSKKFVPNYCVLWYGLIYLSVFIINYFSYLALDGL